MKLDCLPCLHVLHMVVYLVQQNQVLLPVWKYSHVWSAQHTLDARREVGCSQLNTAYQTVSHATSTAQRGGLYSARSRAPLKCWHAYAKHN